jgi:DNA-binding response OmpR family regulator
LQAHDQKAAGQHRRQHADSDRRRRPGAGRRLLRALRAAGYAVDQVGSGSEADAALASHEFDLLILDLGLPKMHGFDVLRKLRARGSQRCRC